MKYIIRKAVLSPVPEVEISATEFAEVQVARAVLLGAFAVEEKYEIVVSNYLELERRLIEVAVSDSVREVLSYSDVFEIRSALNVRMINLLTAVRLYLDQLGGHVGDCLPHDASTAESIKTLCAQEYERHFEYRFMEALRNHVQHRGMPIHFFRQHSQWTSTGSEGLKEYAVYIAAQIDFLAEDGKFKKSVLSEMSGDVDLLSATRRYVESISVINESVRELIADAVSSARSVVESAHRRYESVFEGSLIGLAAQEVDGEMVIRTVPLLLEWDDVRNQLLRRNRQLVNLSKRYVTSKLAK